VSNSFHEVVKKEKDKSLEQAIAHCNKENDLSITQVYEQYSRPQRWFGPAPHVTTTVIESKAEMIVKIQHCHKEDNDLIKKGSLTKYCTPQALHNVTMKLKNISHIVTDCSSSMSKFVDDVLSKTSKHKKIIHSKDIWHVSKNIPVRWTSFLNKKIKKAKKQNLDDQVYEELKHLETTKLKTHYWYLATQKLEPTEFKNKLCNATDYWINRMKLQKQQVELINQFFFSLVDDKPEQYSDGLGSALCESLHNVNNKYCPKGEIYSNTIYETLKNLALLDWNNRKQKFLQSIGRKN
jgi:hypothetical protein